MFLLCHRWLTTTNLSYSFLFLKLPPPPCAVLLVIIIMESWDLPQFGKINDQFASRLAVKSQHQLQYLGSAPRCFLADGSKVWQLPEIFGESCKPKNPASNARRFFWPFLELGKRNMVAQKPKQTPAIEEQNQRKGIQYTVYTLQQSGYILRMIWEVS